MGIINKHLSSLINQRWLLEWLALASVLVLTGALLAQPLWGEFGADGRMKVLVSFGVLALLAVLGLYFSQKQRQHQQLALAQCSSQKEALLRDNAQTLSLALGGAELGMWELNFATLQRNYNDRCGEMLGFAPGEIDQTGTLGHDHLHPDDKALTRHALSRHTSGETTVFEAEYRMRHKLGHWVWIQSRGRVVERGADDKPLRMLGTHRDISERMRVETQQRESDMRFRSLTELSSDWYWEMDEQYRFTRIEGSLATTQGLARQDDLGLTFWDIPVLNMSEAQWESYRVTMRSHEVFRNLELQRPLARGESVWISISGAPCYDGKGTFLGYRGVGREITQYKAAEQKIAQLAYFDELTGLPNRRLLTTRLQQTLEHLALNNRHGALIFIDLDNFKSINDTQGQEVGDLLLKQLAQRLKDSVREIDTVARMGGDEFVVLLKELSAYAGEATFQADGTGKSIMARLNQPYDIAGQSFLCTSSMGIALFQNPLPSVDELLTRANLAMYHAKAAGRNVMQFFDPAMEAAAMARAALEIDLRKGLQRNELRLHFQPVVDEVRHMSGVEALVRWQHPQRGLIYPGEFIDLAEKTGLIIPLGQWVMESACHQLVKWAGHDATQDLSIAVNVSARQFHQPDFVPQVLDLLRRTRANPFRLKLELTESLLLTDIKDAIHKMSQLRAIGVTFSLDDFGTGYSSLSYLKSLPLDQLKIDQSFVRDVLTNPNDAAIVRTILALARSMDLGPVAEGVETEGQRQFLLDNGCWSFQGYLFGKPQPLDELVMKH